MMSPPPNFTMSPKKVTKPISRYTADIPASTEKPFDPDPRKVASIKARNAASCARSNPQKSLNMYLEAATYGHAGANFECGSLYERGISGVLEPDEAEALRYYMVAALGGLANARYNLAFMYERGAPGIRRSQLRALQLLDAAAAGGHTLAAVWTTTPFQK
jgi:TPR repeat protein